MRGEWRSLTDRSVLTLSFLCVNAATSRAHGEGGRWNLKIPASVLVAVEMSRTRGLKYRNLTDRWVWGPVFVVRPKPQDFCDRHPGS